MEQPPTFEVPLKSSTAPGQRVRLGLQQWLGERLAVDGLCIEAVRQPMGTGVSNETLFLDAKWQGGRGRFVARLQTRDPLYLDAGVDKQRRMYEALHGLAGVRVPRVVGYEPDPSAVGTPFFVMERIDGLVPSGTPHFTREGWLFDAQPDQRRRAWRTAVAQLVALHRAPTARVEFLDNPDRGKGGLRQDLQYWRAAYRWATGDERHPEIEAGEQWLLDHFPTDASESLSWGDARLENMVFRDFTCVAMLDFETASLAGATSDLAWWALMDKGSSRLAGLGSPRETLALYHELGGGPLPHMHYHLVLSAFRLAVIYVRLAAQLAARGLLPTDVREFGRTNEKVQQLALLLGIDPRCQVTASLPDIDA